MYFSKLNTLLILFVSIVAILYALPIALTKFSFNEISSYLPGKKVNLGLDLKGGSYILLQAEMKTSEIEFIDNTANSIRNDLRKEKIEIATIFHIMHLVILANKDLMSNYSQRLSFRCALIIHYAIHPRLGK